MRDLFRVLPYRPDARTGEPGHPATTLRSLQGGGRLDNPDLYSTTYLSASPSGAIAERFGRRDPWDPSMLAAPFGGPLASFALVHFRLRTDDVLDLDDPRALLERDLRPSRVVLTDREVTQAWAREIYLEGAWAGVSWWSRWEARWTSTGVWAGADLSVVEDPVPLHIGHDAIVEAAEILNRRVTAA